MLPDDRNSLKLILPHLYRSKIKKKRLEIQLFDVETTRNKHQKKNKI